MPWPPTKTPVISRQLLIIISIRTYRFSVCPLQIVRLDSTSFLQSPARDTPTRKRMPAKNTTPIARLTSFSARPRASQSALLPESRVNIRAGLNHPGKRTNLRGQRATTDVSIRLNSAQFIGAQTSPLSFLSNQPACVKRNSSRTRAPPISPPLKSHDGPISAKKPANGDNQAIFIGFLCCREVLL